MGLFNLFDDVVESGLNILDDVTDGELPRKKDVANVGGAVLTAYAGAELLEHLLGED